MRIKAFLGLLTTPDGGVAVPCAASWPLRLCAAVIPVSPPQPSTTWAFGIYRLSRRDFAAQSRGPLWQGVIFARSELESNVRGSSLKEMSEQSYWPINYKETPDVVKAKQSKKNFFL